MTDELLAEMTRRIVEKFHPYRVLLFGSYACGAQRKDSDVDILVSMDSDDRPAKRSMKVSEVAHIRFVPIDVLVYTPEEIEARLALGDFFVKEILGKGQVLYERDTE